jgi:prepilin-type N-terminal cleavage/methylation domain-containing protein
LPTVGRNKDGFTLIEVVIAMLVFLIGMMAVANVAVMAIHTNMNNMLRDEAVKIGDDLINGQLLDSGGTPILLTVGATGPGIRNLSQASLNAMITANPVAAKTVLRETRGLQRSYSVSYKISALPGTTNMYKAEVWVGWNYKGGSSVGIAPTGQGYQHAISTLLTAS